MRKRKKFNPVKQATSLAKHALKNKAIGCIVSGTPCQLIDLKRNIVVPISPTTVNIISNLRHQWSVFIAVIGLDDSDNHYMKSEEVNVVNPAFQSEMVETLNNRHLKLINGFNQRHLISVAWIATPYIKDWNSADAFNLLDMLGALEFQRTITE
jgi:hypothetical protein